MKKISVIVPVYNAEKYIKRCVDSILSQEDAEFELLLIDDGSSDNSLKICREYEENDDRVRVFHKENGGPAAAREFGLENATGEFITFVDSDDWLREGFIKRVLEVGDSADFIIFGIYFYFKDFTIETIPSKEQKIFTVSEFLASEEIYKYQSSLSGPVSKVYKKSIIEKNDIHFDETMSFAEDSLFNICYLKCCETVLMDDNWFYHCDKNNSGSLTHNYIKNQAECRCKYIDAADEFFSKAMSEKNYKRFVKEQLYNLISSINYIFDKSENKEERYHTIALISQNTLLNTHKCNDIPMKQRIILFLLRHKLLRAAYLVFAINKRFSK